jgi:predicted GH43/DUF377 family glycosyl hydrolase
MKPVNQQQPTTFLDPARMAPGAARCFNAGLAEHKGRRLACYRAEPQQGRCKIRLAELGDDWQPIRDEQIDVPTTQPDANLEDPRLFAGAGGLWLAWTEAHYTAGAHWRCVQRYGKLEQGIDGWAVCNPRTPAYGRNDGSAKEKNWQFFWQDNRLFAVYSHAPQVVIELDGDRVINEWRTPGLAWRWGHPSGGTPPIPYAGGLLTFFHAYKPENRYHRRYNMAALVMQDRPPFAIKAASAWPIMQGSERDPLAADPRWNPLVVFPGGVIHDGKTFHVAQGVNDARCAVSHIPETALSIQTMTTKITGQTARIRLLGNMMVDGYCRMTGDVVSVPAAVARDLIGRKRALLAEDDPAPAMIEPAAAAQPDAEPEARKPRRRKA